MKATHRFTCFLLILFLLGVTQSINASPEPPKASSRAAKTQTETKSNSARTSKEALIDRGRYLATEVARCQYCHTPRLPNGDFDRRHWLQGAPVWIVPPQGAKEQWAAHAPDIAGLPLSNEQALDVLERGVGTNGLPILPPMHRFHLHHEDALAIIAYLRSLPR